MNIILKIDETSTKSWNSLKCSHKEFENFIMSELFKFNNNLKKHIDTEITKIYFGDNFTSQNNMRIVLKIDLFANKTWSEMSGGKIKTIINFHTRKIKNFIKEQFQLEKVDCLWYGDNDSDCSKCIYQINNPIDDLYSTFKLINPSIDDCCFNFKELNNVKDFINNKNNNICKYFEPCNNFLEKISFNEIKELEEIL